MFNGDRIGLVVVLCLLVLLKGKNGLERVIVIALRSRDQSLSVQQAYETKYLNDQPFLCGNTSTLYYLRDKVPETVVMNAFDNRYVEQAQEFAKMMDSLKAAYVGFCREPECVEKFWAGCPGCGAHIVHCPAYRITKEPYIKNGTHCKGWRGIQYIKSYAFYDMIKMGKNVFMADLDHHMKKIDFADLLNRHKCADMLVFMRDSSGFINFGLFFARNTAATASIANRLRLDINKTWDQALFNYEMADLERSKKLHCVEVPYKQFLSRRLKNKRCGLVHTHIKERHHPRCWKPPRWSPRPSIPPPLWSPLPSIPPRAFGFPLPAGGGY